MIPGDVLRPPPVPARVNPLTYLALNRFEQVMEDNHFHEPLRMFRKYWRKYLIDISVDHHLDFSNECLTRLGGRRLYGPWWGPGMLPKTLTDGLMIVHRVIRNTDLEEIFS